MSPLSPGRLPCALVVDDEEVVVTLVEELLTDEGFRVDTASSGAEALVKIGARAYDLVIADKNLPDTSGVALVREVRSLAPDARVVVVTAYGSIESALAALRAGASDYILKPIDDVATFLARVRRALDGPRLDADTLERLDPDRLPDGAREALERLRGAADGEPVLK